MARMAIRLALGTFHVVGAAVLFADHANADISSFLPLTNFAINHAPADANSPPGYSNGEFQITNVGANEARSAFYKTLQSDSRFTASFTYRSQGDSQSDGAAFVIQKSDSGANALGTPSPGLGYSGIKKSVAITLQTSSSTGLFFNGTLGSADSTAPNVIMGSNHKINVSISYDGAQLTETLTDLTTTKSISKLYSVDIPLMIGSSTAYVGFTASTGDNAFGIGANQFISNFTFYAPTGDYNKNGIVDAADYIIWRNSLGQHGANLPADGDGDGTITNSDYQLWKQTFGQSSGVGTASASQLLETHPEIPEPNSFTTVLIGICICGAFARRGK